MRELGIVADGAMPIEDGHADLLPHLINKDQQRVGARHGSRQLAQGLRHEPGVQAHVTVAHLPFQLRPRHKGRNAVDNQNVDRPRTHQRIGDLQRLFAGVRLADQQIIDVHAQLARIGGIQRVFSIDERARAAAPLCLGDRVQCQRRLAGTLRPVDLDDATPGQATDTKCEVKAE